MMWDLSKMEQRFDDVLGVIRDCFTVTEVAQKFGVSRQSVHTWLQRYGAGGLEALEVRATVTPDGREPTTACVAL
jgi:transposase